MPRISMKSSCRGLKLAAWSKPSKHYESEYFATDSKLPWYLAVEQQGALSNVIVQADHHFPQSKGGMETKCSFQHRISTWNNVDNLPGTAAPPSFKVRLVQCRDCCLSLNEVCQEKSLAQAFTAILRSSHLLLSQRARCHVLPMRDAAQAHELNQIQKFRI